MKSQQMVAFIMTPSSDKPACTAEGRTLSGPHPEMKSHRQPVDAEKGVLRASLREVIQPQLVRTQQVVWLSIIITKEEAINLRGKRKKKLQTYGADYVSWVNRGWKEKGPAPGMTVVGALTKSGLGSSHGLSSCPWLCSPARSTGKTC